MTWFLNWLLAFTSLDWLDSQLEAERERQRELGRRVAESYARIHGQR